MDPSQSLNDLTAAAGAAAEKAAGTARAAERKTRSRARKLTQGGTSLGQQAQEWAEEVRLRESAALHAAQIAAAGPDLDPVPLATRSKAEAVGRAIGRVRSMDAEEMVDEVKRFVGSHPASLLGATVAGFLIGRMLRRR